VAADQPRLHLREVRGAEGPLPEWSLSDTTHSDGKPLRGGLIEYFSVRQGGADELLLRVTEEISKRSEKIVLGSEVGALANASCRSRLGSE
jgi:hypothetical protein